jgi:hypothetical protein
MGNWGTRQSARLPKWAQVAFCLFLFWPCVVVPRWRLCLGLSVLTAAGLSVARLCYRVDDLSWGTIAALSTGHVWFPIVVIGPGLLPLTLFLGLVGLACDCHQYRNPT